MSIARKGSRRIIVDSLPYRWSVSLPTYTQAMGEANLSFAVESESGGRTTLLVRTDIARPDIWLGNFTRAITPSVVEHAIRQALMKGWYPSQCGSAFEMTIRLA
ncbi:hypothetical protein LE191_10265 [Janthinobacterium sp. HSC-3S05]|uniref:hypothetical protein n=1 Tax=Janthinobacterium lividum TaxID=29581 RepID=UPI001CD88C1C|nr:hypothetical protein [Janthinobacterium lividum]MCA1860485.1 hypothetical protein [Janthinobacterium lividum]